jgi:hypothetical protein
VIRTIAWIVGIAATLYGLHRLALWMERRGWLYYKHTRGSSSSLGNAFLHVQSIIEPGKRHVLEQRLDEEREENEPGEPPTTGPDPLERRRP